MLFLFNDVVLEIGQPLDVIYGDDFPITGAVFEKMQLTEIVMLAKETIFAEQQLAHENPTKATQLAVLMAAKSGANAVLIGPPAGGVNNTEEIGIRFAEVSLVVMSNLWQLQVGGNLTPEYVYQSVWRALEK